MRVIALIDGEHHPAVTRDALDRLAAVHDLQGVLFVGGEEKVGEPALADPAATWGREVTVASAAPADGLRGLASRTAVDAIIDLSGAPVLDGAARFGLASLAKAEEPPAEIELLAQARAEARAQKDFGESDRLRDEIEAAGWVVRDVDADPGFQLVPKR